MTAIEGAAHALQRSLRLNTAARDPDDYVSSGVRPGFDDAGGRGIYATRTLPERHEILRIPHSALVTATVGQSYLEGQALKAVADDVEAGADWPSGVVLKATPGESVVDFPNEETFIVLALVLEDAMRSGNLDAEVDAMLAHDCKEWCAGPRFDRARRQLYYAALPTVEELRGFHPLFMVVDLEPEPEQPAQSSKRGASPPIPSAVHLAVGNCGLELGEGTVTAAAAAQAAAEDYWSAIMLMHSTVLSEYRSLCAILGKDFEAAHSAEEWLYCWTMVMSRNFLLQIGDPSLGGAMSMPALVPFADLMNHSHNPSASWHWDSGTGQFVMKVDTLRGEGVAEGEELTINYSPGHSAQDPRQQHPPFYFGVFYGFLERYDRRVFLETSEPLQRRPRHKL